jgi:hypothetical protein
MSQWMKTLAQGVAWKKENLKKEKNSYSANIKTKIEHKSPGIRKIN